VTNRRRFNLLRNTTTKADNMKILRCPCCRQINWKHFHNEIVNNMYLDIENNYERGIATLAEHVFYRNWSSIENDENSEDSDSEDSDEDEYLVQPNDMILKEIKIGDIVKLKTEVGKKISVIVNEILQNEYIGTINRLTFDLEFKFGDMVSFSKDDIVSYKNKSRQE
jgi:hypothetical protein